MASYFAAFVTANLIFLKCAVSLKISMNSAVLYDMPVSNFCARVRMIIYAKKIEDQVKILQPAAIGGLKSPEYLSLNAQGKMPLLVSGDGMPIVESDPICRYLLRNYETGPSFCPRSEMNRALSEQIVRIHDLYLGPVQGVMYKAPGTVYSTFGTDRIKGLYELKKQLTVIEDMVTKYESRYHVGMHPTSF